MYDNMIRKLHITESEKITFTICLVMSFLAKGAALFPLSFATDDFARLFHSASSKVLISQGRFGSLAIDRIFRAIGVTPPHANIFIVFIALVAYVLIGMTICRFWKISQDIALSSLVVLLIAIHPYQSEIFTFKIAAFSWLPLVLGLSGYYYASFVPKKFIMSSLLIMFALSMYQIVLNYLTLILSFSLLLDISADNRPAISWKAALEETAVLPRILSMAFGTFVYFIFGRLIQFFSGIEQVERGQMIGVAGLPDRIFEATGLVGRLFLRGEALVPLSLKIILGMILLSGVCAQFLSSRKKTSAIKALQKTLIISILILLSSCWIMGVLLPLKSWGPIPRVLAAIGIFWAGVFVLAYNNLQKRGQMIIAILGAIILIGFAGINNKVFTDQQITNLRDFHTANRMLVLLERQPNFSKIRTVALSGFFDVYPSKILDNTYGINISAYGTPWSNVNLLKEVSGYDFSGPTEQDKVVANEICSNKPKWPEQESVFIVDDIGIICF